MKTQNALRIISAASIGTILEWYDFSLFAFLTPLLASLFFPHENKFTALMMTYAIFAIGFFVRPLGAVIFGHLGDRVGRKKALLFSILLMSLPTFCMGLLPTYQQAGLVAPLLLIILRICQGLSAGGEATGAILFALESVSVKNRGFLSGLLWSMTGVGMLLGSFAALCIQHFSQYAWLWRVPFLLGILTGLVGYFVRRRTEESQLFKHVLATGALATFPLWEGIKKYKAEMCHIVGAFILSAMITYMVFIFMPTYAADIIGLPRMTTNIIATITLILVTFLLPLGGYLSDVIGRKNCLRWSALGFVLLSYPLFNLIAKGSLSGFIIAEIIFVILAAGFQGTVTIAMLEQLPTRVRYTVMAVGYNISYSLFGGTAPLVAGYLVKLTGNNAAPGLYLATGALIAIAATNRLRETFRSQLA